MDIFSRQVKGVRVLEESKFQKEEETLRMSYVNLTLLRGGGRHKGRVQHQSGPRGSKSPPLDNRAQIKPLLSVRCPADYRADVRRITAAPAELRRRGIVPAHPDPRLVPLPFLFRPSHNPDQT
ncbi:unnamed protein product [Chrysodeixis includens]|uniref:Uncharacterized protein n=1 Tax=Chrysodeixis includens TaxID=689277 RepID=A0A9N8KYQ0_CHRIL|nr:unnamed protein product [Chrysodeixis includens]